MSISTLRRALALAALALPFVAAAQAWPARPVRMVAVFPPGGSVDQVARVLSQQLSTQLGQQFVVDNKGGASGSIGTAEVARSAPDGYTFAVVFDTHAVNPALIPNLSFNTTKDLASVTLIGTSPMAIVAHAAQPYRDFREVIAAAKAKPGSVAYGSIGSGSLGHLAMSQLGNQLGIELTHVPYRGGGPLMNDAVAGQVPLAIGTVFLVSPHVKSGKVKALAVTSAKPDASLPGAAPLVEQGAPGFEALAWWGVFAPAGTPQPIVSKLGDALTGMIQLPEVRERMQALGAEPVAEPAARLAARMRADIEKYAPVVKATGLKAE
jgi:tripartite-type tricarboxylate transporter receptor subunit TctC